MRLGTRATSCWCRGQDSAGPSLLINQHTRDMTDVPVACMDVVRHNSVAAAKVRIIVRIAQLEIVLSCWSSQFELNASPVCLPAHIQAQAVSRDVAAKAWSTRWRLRVLGTAGTDTVKLACAVAQTKRATGLKMKAYKAEFARVQLHPTLWNQGLGHARLRASHYGLLSRKAQACL